ncbi:8435_t:CDS:2, partial [Ambispora gerdemannii]
GVCREKSVYKQQQQQDQIKFDVYAMRDNRPESGNGNNSLSKCDERALSLLILKLIQKNVKQESENVTYKVLETFQEI